MNESVRAELAAIMALVQAGQKDEAGGRFFSLYCIICAQCRENRLELLSLLLMAVLFTQWAVNSESWRIYAMFFLMADICALSAFLQADYPFLPRQLRIIRQPECRQQIREIGEALHMQHIWQSLFPADTRHTLRTRPVIAVRNHMEIQHEKQK